MDSLRVKISLELIGDSTDAESIKKCVYDYLIELINDDSLVFDVFNLNQGAISLPKQEEK